MGTAMQRHLEWLKTRIVVTEEMEHNLLEFEKQQIMDAYAAGVEEEYRCQLIDDEIKTSEQYYEETFKSKTYKLNMTITVPFNIKEDDIFNKLVVFAEENGYVLGGRNK